MAPILLINLLRRDRANGVELPPENLLSTSPSTFCNIFYRLCHVLCCIPATYQVVLLTIVLVPTALAQVTRPPIVKPELEVVVKDSNTPIQKAVRKGAPDPDTYRIHGYQESSGAEDLYKLRGKCPDNCAELETVDFLLKADELDWNRDTDYVEARGHVYYENFGEGYKLYADKAEYNADIRDGKFYNVHGTSLAKIDARPGLLTTSNPFYFEGAWAEKLKEKIKLYDGFVTDCLVPRPAWKLTGKKFDLIAKDRAIAYNAFYRLRGVPLFYSPIFYKSLKKNPRKSGFLLPNISRSTRYGWMYSTGIFWAINRSYDVTYRPEYMSERGVAHSLEVRGKPSEKADFDLTLHGVQDREKQGGYVLNLVARADLGGGWIARAQINYLDSFLFRQAFTQSFTEAISSETHSVVNVSKHWDSFAINISYEREVNFQSITPDDRILIRKLPEVQFLTRDRQVTHKILPIWVSLESTFDLLHRDQPSFQTRQYMDRIDVAPRVMTAFNWKGFSLVPSFTLRNTYYDSSFDTAGRVQGNNLVRTSRETMAEFVLPSLERVFKAPKVLGEKIKHVIEARATYRFVDGVQDFNRIIRFDSTELITNTNEVEFSLTNRFYTKRKDGIVQELLSWQLWQRRYFDPTFGGTIQPGTRNVNLSSIDLTGFAFLDGQRHYSPIVSALKFQPNHLSLEWRTDYDPRNGNIVESAVTAGGRWAEYFVTFGHNQLRTGSVLAPNSNQFTTAFGFGKPNKRGWNLGGTLFYNYRTQELNYLSSQVTRNWDCCGVSFQYRRQNYGLILNNVYQFSFSISNIGSFGTLRKQESLF